MFLTPQNTELHAHGPDTRKAQHVNTDAHSRGPLEIVRRRHTPRTVASPSKQAASKSSQRILKELWCAVAVPEFTVAKVAPKY